MENSLKISFIIPAHNAAACIQRAVQSVLHCMGEQGGFEVVIVENGSADETLLLASGLAAEHEEVFVCSSETGVSAARNLGIREARGEWVCFVDADDVCLPELAAVLPALTAAGPELLVAAYKKTVRTVRSRCCPKNQLLPDVRLEKAKARMLSVPTLRMTAWAKFYRRDFLLSNGLFFDESLSRSEDSEFLLRLLNRCRKLMFTNLVVYQYNQKSSSTMRSVSPGIAADYLRAIRKADLAVAESSPAIRSAFPNFVCGHLTIVAVHEFYNCAVRMPWRERNRQMRTFLQENVIRDALSSLTLRSHLLLQNVPAFFFRRGLLSLGGAICWLRSVYNNRFLLREDAGRKH